MDKSTLSNYGWIVIAVLVLAVMIALATPFGTYIKSGVESTTQGLFDTSEKALNVVGMSAGDGSFDGAGSSSSTPVELTTLTAKTWNGLTSFDGYYVWTDGTNMYYSHGSDQYVLNKTTSTWEEKVWNTEKDFDGNWVWSDGINTYLSFYNGKQYHYVLNKTTSTWEKKTWKNYSSFSGASIWNDGVNYVYSNGLTEYVLNGDTWESRVVNTTAGGAYIWTDGTNVYYSQSSLHYIRQGNTWERIGFNIGFSGESVWTDGINTYLGGSYVFDGTGWQQKTWTGLTSFLGKNVWTDGTNYYYSSGTQQYVFS